MKRLIPLKVNTWVFTFLIPRYLPFLHKYQGCLKIKKLFTFGIRFLRYQYTPQSIDSLILVHQKILLLTYLLTDILTVTLRLSNFTADK